MLSPVQNSAVERQLQRPILGRIATGASAGFVEGDYVSDARSYTAGGEGAVTTSKTSRALRDLGNVREGCAADHIALLVNTNRPRQHGAIRDYIFVLVELGSTRETATREYIGLRKPRTA